eukprot:scaffold6853_cov52-Cylindrotheca_fusiformis.AAC.2
MSVPTPLILFDQIVSRSFGPCWFWLNGSPADRVGEAFVVVFDVFVVRDCWVLRESGIPVTPGGCGTGKRRFPGMK